MAHKAVCGRRLRGKRVFGLLTLWSGAVGVDAPLTASLCQNEVVADLRHRRPSMDQIIRIGMDTSVRRETGKE
jgi:transposase